MGIRRLMVVFAGRPFETVRRRLFQQEPEPAGAADALERHEAVRRGWVR